MLERLVFTIVALATFYWAYLQYSRLYRNIHLGRDEEISGNEAQRWKNLLLVAFGQKKMFKRIIPAVFHFFIYVAFLFTQLELIEIFIDGFSGKHRVFAGSLGPVYTILINFIEILSLLALVGTVIFLARRNALKLPRFHKPEMTLWPKLDANLILFGEIALVTGIFLMNSADVALQSIDPSHYPDTGTLLLSGSIAPFLQGLDKNLLVLMERAGWWLHILTVFAFINYLPKSKHLHIFLAFPNIWYAKLNSRGEMSNMEDVSAEVKSMLGLTTDTPEMTDDIPEFGAKDIFDLSWKNIMDAYSCTECGRCTSVCPANLTGKKLSPRKILMDIRDRAEEVGNHFDTKNAKTFAGRPAAEPYLPKYFDDGKSLWDYISREEIHACTTCNACVEACPVMINPLDPILQLRRYEILTEAAGPKDWTPMFTNLENSSSPWQMPVERDAWINA